MIIPNFGFGGAERSFSKVSLELAKNFKVYIVVFNTIADHVYPHGGEIIDLGIAAGNSISDKLNKFYLRIKKVKKIKELYHIDISISFLEGADYVNILSKGKEKVIISIRGSKSHDGEISGWLGKIRKKFLIPFLYQKADKIVAINNDLKKELICDFNLQGDKIDVIYNFYDVESIVELSNAPIHESYELIFCGPVIINSGRLHPQKEQYGLLQAYALLAEKTAKLVLIGDGPLADDLILKSKGLGLSTYWWGQDEPISNLYDVYFLGYQNNPFNFFKRSTLFAFSSSWEGFGNVLVEAMICALPVITTDCPSGPREILAPSSVSNFNLESEEHAEFGILMPLLNTGDSSRLKEWSKSLDNLLCDASLREHYVAKSLERMKDFSVEKVSVQWLNSVNEMLL